MPRGVKLTPEERSTRNAEIEKKKEEKRALREQRKKLRAAELAEREARREASGPVVVAAGTSPTIEQLLDLRAGFVTDGRGQKVEAILFASASDVTKLAGDANLPTDVLFYAGPSPSSVREASEVLAQLFPAGERFWVGAVFPLGPKHWVVGGMRSFRGTVSLRLESIGGKRDKLRVAKVGLETAVLMAGASSELAFGVPKLEVLRELLDADGEAAAQELGLKPWE